MKKFSSLQQRINFTKLKLKQAKPLVKLFGLDNDAGLLSFPYSFTNSEKFIKKNNFDAPPYILFKKNMSPIARVYGAIEYLITDNISI